MRMTDESCFFDVPAQLGVDPESPALHVAMVGRDRRGILDGLAAFPTSRVALLHSRTDSSRARRLREEIITAGIPVRLISTGEGGYWDVLGSINDLVAEARLTYSNIHVNVSSGTRDAGCAATVACYLHGLRAFHVEMDRPMMLPMLNSTPREQLSEDKTKILLALRSGGPRSMHAVARGARIPVSDVRAHLNGEPGHKGLVDLGLVARGRFLGFTRGLHLTQTGTALLSSSFPPP